MQPLIRITQFFPGYDFLVQKGEFITIFNPNDLANSFLLRFLGLLEGDFHGLGSALWADFYFRGQNLDALSSSELISLRQNEIGFCLNDFDLIPSLNVLENVALPLRFIGIPKTDSLHAASAILATFGLNNREYFFPHQLSSVQKQRITLARSVVNSPSLLLVENPTKSLNQKSKSILLDDLSRIAANGTTIIATTHDDFLATHSSRIIKIMDEVVILDCLTSDKKPMPTFTTAAPQTSGKIPIGNHKNTRKDSL